MYHAIAAFSGNAVTHTNVVRPPLGTLPLCSRASLRYSVISRRTISAGTPPKTLWGIETLEQVHIVSQKNCTQYIEHNCTMHICFKWQESVIALQLLHFNYESVSMLSL
jgi:hypothetical protein